MGFLKRHPLGFAILAFILISLPSGVAAWLSIWEKTRRGNFGDLDWTGYVSAIDWLQTVPLLGIALFLVVLWQIWKPQSGVNNEDQFAYATDDLPHRLRSEISYVHFGWLWKDDPYILCGLVISNSSPFDIEITGVKGSANINDTPCTRDAKVHTNFGTVVVPKFTWQKTVSFYQPLSEAHAKTLRTTLPEGVPIPFELSPVEWTGTIDLFTGQETLLQRFFCAEQFEVDGSRITQDHSQANVQRNRLAGSGPERIPQQRDTIYARLAELRADGVERRNNRWHKIKTEDQIIPWWESEL